MNTALIKLTVLLAVGITALILLWASRAACDIGTICYFTRCWDSPDCGPACFCLVPSGELRGSCYKREKPSQKAP